MNGKDKYFSEDYIQPERGTIDVEKVDKENLKIEAEKYGIAKPRRKIIRARIAND